MIQNRFSALLKKRYLKIIFSVVVLLIIIILYVYLPLEGGLLPKEFLEKRLIDMNFRDLIFAYIVFTFLWSMFRDGK